MIADMLEELRATNSGPEKVEILKKYNTTSIRNMLATTYNPYVTYGIANLATNKPILDSKGLNIAQCVLLAELQSRQLSGNNARQAIADNISSYGGLIALVINKDLKCGISATTINKAFPKLIPTFKIQLAKEVPFNKLTFPMIAQLKYDGVRIVVIVSPTDIQIRTRNGKHVDLPHLRAAFKGSTVGMYDGELIYAKGKSDDRTTVSGLVNSAMHGGKVSEFDLTYVVFDYLLLKEYNAQLSTTPYSLRRTTLTGIVNKLPQYVQLADQYKVHSIDEVNALYAEMISKDFEGLILKPTGHKYTFKRSKDWVKLKEIKSADLECIDTIEGTGKYEGMIGALQCKGTVEGVLVGVNVGSGLADALRYVDTECFIGKIIEVKYNSLIKDSKTGCWSLFLPRFVEVRHDKTV